MPQEIAEGFARQVEIDRAVRDFAQMQDAVQRPFELADVAVQMLGQEREDRLGDASRLVGLCT